MGKHVELTNKMVEDKMKTEILIIRDNKNNAQMTYSPWWNRYRFYRADRLFNEIIGAQNMFEAVNFWNNLI